MQTPNTLNITVGTDVILNVTLEHEGVVLNPALIDNLQANLITGLGRKTPLETGLGADYITIAIPWVEGRLAGCHSLEVKGSINGLAWAAIGKGLIRYTNGTEAGADSVTVEADAYDVTMEAGYHYSDSPIAAVHVSVDDEYGTPSADVTYQHKVLGLGFHNLRGNGITKIDVDEQVGDEAVNTVTFKTDADHEGTKLQVRNGSRGNGIASSSEELSPMDGGTNTFTFVDDDGTEHVLHTKNGRTGAQGDSVIVGQGDLPLAHTLGQDNTKAMSQKGVTDAINSGKISNGETTQTLAQPYYNNGTTTGLYVNSDTGAFVAAAAHRSIELDLTPDMKSITYKASAYSSHHGGYAFVKDDGTYVSGVNTTSAVNVTADVRQAMAMGATKFRCSINTTSGSAISLTIKKETFSWPQRYESIGDNTNGWMSQRAVKEALSMEIAKKSDLTFSLSWYINSSGNWASTNASNDGRRADITLYRGKTIKVTANSSYGAEIAFLKSFPSSAGGSASGNYCTGTSKVSIAAGGSYTAVVPDDCVYFYMLNLYSGNNRQPSAISILEGVIDIVAALPQKMSDMASEQIAEAMKVTLAEISTFSTTTWDWYINDSGVWSSTTGSNYANILDGFSIYKGKNIAVHAGSNGNCRIAFLKSLPSASGSTVSEYCEGTRQIVITQSTVYNGVVPEDCAYFYVRHMYGGTDVTPTKIVVGDSVDNVVEEIASGSKPVVYVSSSGNDNNPGTANAPMKTIAAALDAGAADMTVVLLSDITGGISLNNWNGKKNHVTIRGDKNQNRKIIVGKKLAGEGWQAYEGYDDVYSYTKGDGESLPTDSIQSQYLTYYWLWQYDIADTRSLISASERHPLQRGRQYRMRSTRVEYVATLAALLAATSPCWTLDDGKLYVRVVAGSDTAANPIYMPSDYGNAITTGNFRVTLSNIETWFGRIYVGGWAQSSKGNGDYLFEATDCAVRCCTGSGGWQIDDGVSVHLERCEAEGVTMIGSTGDGFNLHPQSGDTRPYAKDSTHTLVDCWAHDNRDDGYSDHGRSEGTIIGGLFEHNGKGGLAPSTGSHDTIYNATCQNNNSGILAGGITEGGGIGTQVSCFGCVCINNLYNFNCVGYTAAQQVKLELNNCISRRAKTNGAAIYAHDPCEVVVRDCTDYGSPIAKKTESDGVITIDNGTVIS
jgi:hypothetical protein